MCSGVFFCFSFGVFFLRASLYFASDFGVRVEAFYGGFVFEWVVFEWCVCVCSINFWCVDGVLNFIRVDEMC